MRAAAIAVLAVLFQACSQPSAAPKAAGKAVPVRVDGSSTVFLITSTVAKRYAAVSKNAVEVASSGTGGGFQKFCHGRTDINGASRPINGNEVKACAAAGVEYLELPIAFDGIAVVVNRDNDWVASLAVADLKRLWEPAAQAKVQRWSDIRPEWPKARIHLAGPGHDSGTYDYFTKAIVGQEGESRHDYLASEDDEVLVDAVSRDGLALGFFGFAYYHKHRDHLRAVPIDDSNAANGRGAVEPTPESIRDAKYQPLSRPLFIYVSTSALSRSEVADFTRFYVDAAAFASEDAGYVPLPRRAMALVEERFATRVKGSAFEGGGSELGLRIETLLMSHTAEVRAQR